MGLKSINGTYLKDEWKEAANTFLGTTISGYPNSQYSVHESVNCRLTSG